jgi:hypothetical protein
MASVRPVGYGLLAFPVVVGLMLATYPSTIVLAGLPVGFLVGYASDGWIAGLLNGLLAGLGIAFLFMTATYYVVTAPDRVAPGVGIALFLFALIAVALGVESTLAGAFGGLTNR